MHTLTIADVVVGTILLQESKRVAVTSVERCPSARSYAHVNGSDCYWVGTLVKAVEPSSQTASQGTTFTPMSPQESSAIAALAPAQKTRRVGKKAPATGVRAAGNRFPVSVSYLLTDKAKSLISELPIPFILN